MLIYCILKTFFWMALLSLLLIEYCFMGCVILLLVFTIINSKCNGYAIPLRDFLDVCNFVIVDWGIQPWIHCNGFVIFTISINIIQLSCWISPYPYWLEIDQTDNDLDHDKYEWEMTFGYEDMIMSWFSENFTKWRLDDVISQNYPV